MLALLSFRNAINFSFIAGILITKPTPAITAYIIQVISKNGGLGTFQSPLLTPPKLFAIPTDDTPANFVLTAMVAPQV
ncbi:MAG: hypothetical protein RIF36_12050 [Imperialibacter sp.]|uniref:hypothetical protein n=1 Tax=Imperialibacter sp. TaxID=2038411 RepID=UPI0032ED0B2D